MAQLALDTAHAGERTAPLAAASVRYDVLDSWRGISALMVALMHFPVAGPLADSAFIRSAFLFVDFFFVLSGFVIASGYGHRLATGAELRRFVTVRFGRLYPLHLFVLAVFVAFEALRALLPQLGSGSPPFTGETSLAALVPNLLLLHGAGFMDGLTWNGVSWSISTEFIAYLAFAAAVFVLGRRSWIALVAAALAGPVVLYLFSPHYMDATWDYGLVRCLYGFALGALLQRFAGEGIARAKLAASGTSVPWTLAEAGMVAVILGFVSWAGPRPEGIAAPLVFAAALYVFAHEGGLVSRVLRGRIFLWLGAISYSVYMLHIFIQSRMINAGTVLDRFAGTGLIGEVSLRGSVTTGFAVSPAAGLALTALMVALVLVAATITHRLIEMPALGWFRRRAKAIR